MFTTATVLCRWMQTVISAYFEARAIPSYLFRAFPALDV